MTITNIHKVNVIQHKCGQKRAYEIFLSKSLCKNLHKPYVKKYINVNLALTLRFSGEVMLPDKCCSSICNL